MRLNRRDANEAKLVELWQAVGCVWIPMERSAGFDGLLIAPQTGVHIVEIKDGRTSDGRKKRWKLTDAERKRCEQVENAGRSYVIIENEEQAAELAGVEINGGTK